MAKSNLKNLFWELSHPDIGESSYLYGTIHLPEIELYFALNEVKKIIEICTVFMSEFDLDDGSDLIAESMLIEDEKCIRDYIHERKYRKLHKSLLKSFGFDLNQYTHLKPIIFEQVLTEIMVKNAAPILMDMALWQYAKQENKILKGAESVESQISVLNSIPIDVQIKSLIKIGQNPSAYKKNIEHIIGYYKNQDLRMLYKLSRRSLGKLKSTMLYNRNFTIADSIEKIALSSNVCCAVGAGHLYGKFGLLSLLKHRSFSLKPVKIG